MRSLKNRKTIFEKPEISSADFSVHFSVSLIFKHPLVFIY